jgi:VanZ family protein
MDRKWHERIIRYVPLFLWVGFIFFMSSSTGSMSETSRFIRPFLEFLFPGAPEETLRLYHGYIRKLAHLVEYAILALLAFRSFTASSIPAMRRMRFVLPMAIVLCVAAADEFNQSFNARRTSSIWDVAIDAAGGITALVLAGTIVKLRKKSA